MGWLSGWAKRRKITIDNTNIDSDLDHFPVPVPLGTAVGQSDDDVSSIFDELGSESLKIAVTKSDGTTQIYAEVEQWDDTNEKALLWASKSDLTLTASSVTELYIYYDSSQSDNTTYIGTPGNRTEVWHSDFVGVYHLSEQGDGTTNEFKDSTSYGYHGTANGTVTRVDGPLNYAQELDGNSCIDLKDIDELEGISDLAMSGFLATTIDQDGRRVIGAEDRFQWLTDSPNTIMRFRGGTSLNGDSFSSATEILSSDNTFYHVSIAVISEVLYCTFEGALDSNTPSCTGNTPSEGASVKIGQKGDGAGDCFSGLVAEIRILKNSTSDAWRKTDYHAQTDNLLTWGTEETEVAAPSVTTNAADSITETTATLNGTLDDLGGESSVDVYFEWGTTTSYGNTTTQETMSATGSFDAGISGLSDGTTYHFRAAVTDGVDTWYGADAEFTAGAGGLNTFFGFPF